ncbi:1451_t:CDS:2, partial [Ambispora leptoticha]
VLLGDIPKVHLQAQARIKRSQQLQKLRHNSRIHKDKLGEKWEGPFYVYDILGNGVYKLRTMADKVLKQKVYGNRLKLYQPPPR